MIDVAVGLCGQRQLLRWLCRERHRARPEYLSIVEFVEAGGLTIAYERVGDGPPLVFVHGAAVDSRTWQPQLAGLADEFTVVAWDEPGAGRRPPCRRVSTWRASQTGSPRDRSARGRPRAHRRPVLGWNRGARALPPPWARRDPDHDRHLRRLEGIAARGRGTSAGCRCTPGCSAAPKEDPDPTLPDSSLAIRRRSTCIGRRHRRRRPPGNPDAPSWPSWPRPT